MTVALFKNVTQKIITASLLFPLTVPLVGILSVILIAFTEHSIGFYTLFHVGDINMLVGILMFGIPTFVFTTKLFLKIDAVIRSAVFTHISHCFLIYLVALFGGVSLLLNLKDSNGLGYAYGVILFTACGLAIICNLITVFKSNVKYA